MLDGWYCRTLANEQAAQQEEINVDGNDDDSASEESQDPETPANEPSGSNGNVDHKSQYRYLKRKLKFLIYENEFFQDSLRVNQRRLLKVSKDRAFLLDRLLQYEKVAETSSDSEETESSDEEIKKRKIAQSNPTNGNNPTRGRKKKINANPANTPQAVSSAVPVENALKTTEPVEKVIQDNSQQEEQPSNHQGHMTSAEIERHLQFRQPVIELMPERAPATVPTEMFSNEPSLDSESNEHIVDGSSPSHVAAEECVPMEYSN